MEEMKTVRGVFHDEERVRTAVERLLEHSVPADEIEVTVLDAAGAPKRDMPVEDESGVLNGALMGAAIGGWLGLMAAALAVGLSAGWSELLSSLGLSWTLRGALVGAVGGLPLGAIIGMGRWRKDEDLATEDLDAGSVVVEVHSGELADVARTVLGEVGADRVTVTSP